MKNLKVECVAMSDRGKRDIFESFEKVANLLVRIASLDPPGWMISRGLEAVNPQ